jgi:antitoxin VapB
MFISLSRGSAMPLQIANPAVVEKVERLALRTGLNKTAAVEKAVDRMLAELQGPQRHSGQLTALLSQLDRIPDRADAKDPLEWDEHGLPV